MTETVKIKPAGHNMVRNPDAGMMHLDKSGEYVTLTPYWHRRIADGDVKVVEETPPAKESK